MQETLTDQSIVNSALWAAFGDAIGFITELTSARNLRRRLGYSSRLELKSWPRRIGGRFGIEVRLPAGCYSDDTQLRLATSRCIGFQGKFDVTTFANVELPVWRSYALGAGRGTKAAADSLCRSETTWYSNFFRTRQSVYVDAGGNGAAMRIQPHVWASTSRADIACTVFQNAVTTHGHVAGILGALFHALLLHEALTGTVRNNGWLSVAAAVMEDLQKQFDVCLADENIRTHWVPRWEHETGRDVRTEYGLGLEAAVRDLLVLERLPEHGDPRQRYRHALSQIGCLNNEYRGSGIKTAIAAVAALIVFQGNPRDVLTSIALELDSDTDTIATMAGALLGATTDEPCSEPIMDRTYIVSEAKRMFELRLGRAIPPFSHSSSIGSSVPLDERDFLEVDHNGYYRLAGLGKASRVGEDYTRAGDETVWRWIELEIGQTVLVKSRKAKESKKAAPAKDGSDGFGVSRDDAKLSLFVQSKHPDAAPNRVKSLDEITQDIIVAQRFDPSAIGRSLLSVAARPDGVEQAVALAAILAKAYRRRQITPANAEARSSAVLPQASPALNLQLTGDSDSSGQSILSGTITNYGRAIAKDVTIKIPTIHFSREISVIEPSEISAKISLTLPQQPDDHSTVIVDYKDNSGQHYRQTGELESISSRGAPKLILKGLSVAERL